MKLQHTLAAFGLAAGAVLATAAVAMAAPAYVNATLNVRSGPGTGYAVVDVLRAGETVDVRRCQGSWCFVNKRGPDGWVSSRYLSSERYWEEDPYYDPYPPRRPRPQPWPYYNPPGWNFEFQFGNNPRPRPQVTDTPNLYPDGQPIPRGPNGPGGVVCYDGPYGQVCDQL